MNNKLVSYVQFYASRFKKCCMTLEMSEFVGQRYRQKSEFIVVSISQFSYDERLLPHNTEPFDWLLSFLK